MRKFISLNLMIFLGIFLTSISYGSSDTNIKKVGLTLNGTPMTTEVTPIIKGSRTLLPIRNVFETLGGTVHWDEANTTVTINYKNNNITLTLNQNKILVNNKEVTIDVAPDVIKDSVFIPLRSVFENLGIKVNWITSSSTVTLTTPEYFSTLPKDMILGYTTSNYSGDKSSFNALTQANNINTIATFSYSIDSKGNLKLTGGSQKDSIDYALKNNITPLVLIHNLINGSFNSNVAHSALLNKTTRTTLINNILTTIAKNHYSGVNIDLENIKVNDRSNYTSFIKELKETLTQYGFLTTISIPAKNQDFASGGSWGSAFDYKELGKYADKIELMTYDEHYSNGSPGPIASLPWVDSVLTYATSLVAPNKIILGLAGYGYDWANGGSRVVIFNNVTTKLNSLNIQNMWDTTSSSPYFLYTLAGKNHEVWYEDIDSLSSKVDLVKKYSLGGVALWRLGFDNSSFWTLLDNKFKYS